MEINNDVKPRQIMLFFALFCPIAKLFIMPASYCYYSGKDCHLGVAIQGIIDIIFLYLILSVIQKDSRSLYEIFCSALGKAATKIIFFILSLYYLLKAIVPILEQLLICYEVLYESTPKSIFFIPLFIVAFYASVSGFNGIFRSIELFSPFILFSLLCIGFLSLTSVELNELLPILEYGVYPLKKGMESNLLWFCDFTVLLPLIDHVKLKDNDGKKIVFSYFLGILIVVAFLVITVGIFGNSAARQVFLISKISKYSIAFSNLGRIDFIFIIILFLGETLYFSFLLSLSTKTLSIATGFKSYLSATIICGSATVFTIGMLLKSYEVIAFLQEYSLCLFAPIDVLFPIFLPIISKITLKNEKKLSESSS